MEKKRMKSGEAPDPDKPMRSGFTTGACATAVAKGPRSFC